MRGQPFRTIILAAVLCCAASVAAAASSKPRLIQKRYVAVTAGTSVGVTLKKANTAGNLLIAYVVWDGSGTATLSDGRGNAYASAAGPTTAGDGTSAQLFYAANVAAGTNTVTATFSAAVATRGVLYVHEYAGLDRTAPLTGAVAAAGAGTAIDSGVLAATAGDVLFAAGASNGKSITRLAHGFHARARKYGNVTADETVKTAGAYRATATGKGTAWVMQLADFRQTAAVNPSTAYPLKVSANGRYLVDQNDHPFLITGDSPQALTVNLSEAEADAFFADR